MTSCLPTAFVIYVEASLPDTCHVYATDAAGSYVCSAASNYLTSGFSLKVVSQTQGRVLHTVRSC